MLLESLGLKKKQPKKEEKKDKKEPVQVNFLLPESALKQAEKEQLSEDAKQILEDIEKGKGMSQEFQSCLLFAAAAFLGFAALIEGTSGWYQIHRFVRGVFGFSLIVMITLLLYAAFTTNKPVKEFSLRRSIFALTVTMLSSAVIQMLSLEELEKRNFSRAMQYLYFYTAEHPITSGGILGGIIAFPLTKLLGQTGARIVTILLAFLAAMRFFNIGMQQLIQMLFNPVQKMRRYYNEEQDVVSIDDAYEKTDDLSGVDFDDFEEKPAVDLPKMPRSLKQRLLDLFTVEVDEKKKPKKGLFSGIEPERDEDYDEWREELPPAPASPPVQKPPRRRSEDYFEEEFMPILNKPAAKPNRAQTAQAAMKRSGTEKPPVNPEDEASVPPKKPRRPRSARYRLPSLNLLNHGINQAKDNAALISREQEEKRQRLKKTFDNFEVDVTIPVGGVKRGPSVTRFEVIPGTKVKVSQVTKLSDDIALALAAQGVRMEAPIPGKAAIGIEVPNRESDLVSLRDILESENFRRARSKLSFAVGKDIAGTAVVGDVAKMPHLIIAGATGSGKSVCTNSIIMSILYHATPEEVKMILIDPKVVEFKVYEGIPHLLIPVVTEPKKAAGALAWAVGEMQRRYNLFAEHLVRDIAGYNEMLTQNGEKNLMPQILIVIDELADLMMTTGKEVEDSICRLAQKARAAGMHLVIATQRPTTDVITGLIKANIPSRIALSVSSNVDSRTIIDQGGAEKLLGHGDMLYMPQGESKPRRVQGCFTSSQEVEKVVAYIKSQAQASYSNELLEQVEQNVPVTKEEQRAQRAAAKALADSMPKPGSDEDLMLQAVRFAVEARQVSTSMLQRRMGLGYARAARIMDMLEEQGIVGPSQGAKPRKVLMTPEEFPKYRDSFRRG